MEFTQSHEEALTHSAWQVAIDDDASTPYLFKFSYDEQDLSCCFLVTDTKRVWAEVLASRHILRRAERLGISEDDVDMDRGAREALTSIITLHSFKAAESLSLSVLPSRSADLLLRLSGESSNWEWELEALPRPRSAEIISRQLVMPMLGWSSVVLDKEENVPQDQKEVQQLEKKMDASGRTAVRYLHKMVAAVVGKPLFSTALRRWTETAADTGMKSAIFVEAEDEPEPRLTAPSPPVKASLQSAQAQSQKSSQPARQATPSPSRSPVPSRASTRASAKRKQKREDTDSETETEPEDAEADDDPHEVNDEKEEDALEPTPEPSPPRKGSGGRGRAVDTDEDQDKEEPQPPAKAARDGARKRTRAADDDRDDVNMADAAVGKPAEEEEGPAVKKPAPSFAPKSRIRVKRSKY